MSRYTTILTSSPAEQPTENFKENVSRVRPLDPLLTRDPRPDLDAKFGDGRHWLNLFRAAWEVSPRLAGTLHGFRAAGVRLAWSKKHGCLALRAGECQASEYEDLKKRWLVPELEILKRLLHETSKVVNKRRGHL